jgi:hypothetical protein
MVEVVVHLRFEHLKWCCRGKVWGQVVPVSYCVYKKWPFPAVLPRWWYCECMVLWVPRCSGKLAEVLLLVDSYFTVDDLVQQTRVDPG